MRSIGRTKRLSLLLEAISLDGKVAPHVNVRVPANSEVLYKGVSL